MATFFLIAGALALSVAMVWTVMRPVMAAVAAYFGAWALMKSGYAIIPQNELLFWAVAVIIVVGIQFARGRNLSTPVAFRCYIAGGALTLTTAGALLGHPWMVAGAVAGVALGALAYMRLRHVASSGYWRQVVASGAPVVVAMILIGLSVAGLVLRANII